MNIKQNSGFGMIGVVLVAVAVALVGLIGWRVYDANKNKQTSTAVGQKSTTGKPDAQSQTSDPYLGWKTYAASLKGYSFKYPSDWSISQQKSGNLEAVTLTAPQRVIDGTNYQFSLMFRIFKPLGLDTQQANVLASNEVSPRNFPRPLYSVISGAVEPTSSFSYGKAGFVYASSTSYPPGELDSKDVTVLTDTATGQEVEFSGSYVKTDGEALSYFDSGQFEKMDDVQTAIKIFGSLADK